MKSFMMRVIAPALVLALVGQAEAQLRIPKLPDIPRPPVPKVAPGPSQPSSVRPPAAQPGTIGAQTSPGAPVAVPGQNPKVLPTTRPPVIRPGDIGVSNGFVPSKKKYVPR